MNDTRPATSDVLSPDHPPVSGLAIECGCACAMCVGTGRIDDLPCNTCEGSGFGSHDMQRIRDDGDDALSTAALIGMATTLSFGLAPLRTPALNPPQRPMTPQAMRSPAAPDGWV
jgi:hypothetical protein